jgi:uncharacterized membrane protein YGL010W
MQKLAPQLKLYQSFHTLRITKITHFIGIPCLVFALLIFLGWLHLAMPPLFNISLSWLGIIAILIYYYFLDVMLAAGLTVILILMGVVATFISQPMVTITGVLIWLFFLIVGIIAQAVGHFYEKNKPAFMSNINQILIAPLFVFAELMFALGYRQDLKDQMK